uniref:Receptor-binding cancer antigen expressed on SiSo cells n=1 Tax=Glossina austeni TaxID=7395 RepID=A0A1A9UZI5_GLOAU
MVLQQIKVLILSLIGLFRRALCCLSGRRKPSFSEPMTNVVVDNNYKGSSQTNRTDLPPERDWNSWDDNPRTVQEHIEQYRQRIAKPPTPQTEEPEPDYFKELIPVIQPQPKYYLNNHNQQQIDLSRLEAKSDVPITLNADLEDWEDDETGGWEEMDTEEARQLLREKRREMRNKRQKLLKAPATEIAIDLTNNGPPRTIKLNS